MVNENREVEINKLPVETWNWLKMNKSSIELNNFKNEGCIKEYEIPTEGIIYDHTERMKELNIESGMGIDLPLINSDLNIKTDSIYVKPNHNIKKVLKMDFKYHDNKQAINNIEIYAAENSKVTIIMDYKSNRKDCGKAMIQTKLYAERNAEINLFQVQLVGDDFLNLNNIGGKCEDGAVINIKQIILGGKERYYGCCIELAGDNSKMTSEISYLGIVNQSLDMNYVVNHQGKKTTSDIKAVGALQDKANKLFRGTIDFKRGAAGSKGKENENVLLIGDGVRNKTIPVILCKEEDVEGSHGASIGKIDEEILFYLASRGLDTKAAYDLLEQARVDSLCRKIKNRDVWQEVMEYMERDQENYEEC